MVSVLLVLKTCSGNLNTNFFGFFFPLFLCLFPFLPSPFPGQSFQGEAAGYSVETLIIVILAPVIVLIVFSAAAVLIIRRIQKNHMERLNSRDAEYGTIEGLIASNVGDSTLAVSTCVRREKPCELPSLLTPLLNPPGMPH